MKYSTTHLFLISCLILFFSTTQNVVMAQTPQSQSRTQQSFNSDEMREIEEMKQMVRERKEHQRQQEQILKDLENAIANLNSETNVQSKETSKPNTVVLKRTTSSNVSTTQPANYYDAGRPKYVTSESILSRLEAMEQLNELKKQYEMDMKASQREIELLKKQLAIANEQIDRYKTKISTMEESNMVSEEVIYYDQQSSIQQPKAKKGEKQKKKKKTNGTKEEVEFSVFEESSIPSYSDKNKQLKEEIEMMKKDLRERKERQARQHQEMEDLMQMAQPQK